jgi:hypothetical protein
MRAFWEATRSDPGATRSEILAFASGIRELEAPATAGASSPIAVTEGFVQRRLAMLPVPIRASPQEAGRRSVAILGDVVAIPIVGGEAGHGHVALSSSSRETIVARTIRASGAAPP